jgi:hypothetical protein
MIAASLIGTSSAAIRLVVETARRVLCTSIVVDYLCVSVKMDGSKLCAEWTAGGALMQEQESPLSTYEPIPSRRLGRSMGINN